MSLPRTFKALSHEGQETGFRLGGAQVAVIPDKAALNKEIEQVLEEKGVGILAIPEDMEDWITEKNRKALKRAKMPLLARYAYPAKWEPSPEADKFTEGMVFRSIGYHMRIKL